MIQDEYNIKSNKKGRIGRPTVAEQKGDPDLAEKAMILRIQGLSWSQIATELDVSRTNARRLCQKVDTVCQNGEEGEGDGELREEGAVENTSAEDDYLALDEIYEHMPKSYQRFVRLLREVRGMD